MIRTFNLHFLVQRLIRKIQKGGPIKDPPFSGFFQSTSYERGEVLLPLADGGHGVPGVGLMPELFELPLLAVPLPEVEGEGLDGLPVDPEAELFGEPGKVPHGPLVEFPELFGLFGFADGEVLPGVVVDPGVEDRGVAEPGVVVFGVPLGEGEPGVVWGVPAGGVAVPAGGVAVLAGGVAVPAGGVAAPGVELCPAVPEPPAGAAPPAGALCATTQPVQHKITDSNASFVIDISHLPAINFSFNEPKSSGRSFRIQKKVWGVWDAQDIGLMP